MPEITLTSLKQLWSKEKDFYITAEVGSGVQKFVYKLFECSELLNLKEGKGSTKDIKRKNEFLEEVKKKGRKADVVIFIDSDIIIPVEVEKHGNIKAGITQLYNYQTDWIKKYGILTDGNEWRFYNNTIIEKTFYIDDILNNPKKFLTFWKEYITPDYYYRSFFEKKGQLKLIEHIPNLDEVREDFFKDITKLIENFEDKLNLKGYFSEVEDETEQKKKAVEITYAYLIQFILYKVLVDNAFSDFQDDWKERIKGIERDLKNKSYDGVLNKIKAISEKISDKIYKRFNDEQENINARLKEILNQPKHSINDVSVWLDILLFINRYNFANVQNEIFGYVYENYLKDLYLNEKKGQYFTDPNVVGFMLNEMGYTKDVLKKRCTKEKDSISIIDPSCGSGTFLYNATARLVDTFFDNSQSSAKATEQLINDNVFGLDIAEFPLYLAEMNILMQMLPVVINEKYNNPVEQKIKMFKTRDSIAEFLDTAIRNTLTDVTTEFKRNKSFQFEIFTDVLDLGYESFMRDKGDLDNLKQSLEYRNKIPRYRFDYVIGNPPYVTYNELSKQQILFVELLQAKKIQMSDIYGVNLNTVPGRIKAYAPKPNLYSFFIALGLALLKDKGKLCYIIPQNILTATDLDVIRHHLSTFVTIEKIINFSCNMFVERGIHQEKSVPTSSLIFVVSKIPPSKLHQVEIINYQSPNDDVITCLSNIKKSKKVFKKKVLQNNLRQNIDNWNYIKFDKETEEFFYAYDRNDYFDIYRIDDYSIPKFKSSFYFDKGLIFPKDKILSDSPDEKHYQLVDTKQEYYSVSTIPKFIKKEDLIFPKGAQGVKVYDAQYKIIWRYMNTEKFHFSKDNIMITHNWVLITSDNKNEILFIQSLLNSAVNRFVLLKLFSNENEKSFQVGIKSVKEFCRVPKINSFNEHIKTEIITQTEKMLEMENQTFADLVDFKNMRMQKFDSVEVDGNHLIFHSKDNSAQCKILSHPKLVEEAIYKIGQGEMFNKKESSISELKNTITYDNGLQQQIKNYIDDLVFALYFKVKLSKFGLQNSETIKDACNKHRFYKLVNLQNGKR